MTTTCPPGDRFDLVVIGGGTAGMTVAKLVARAGWRVVLIEAERTGGDCLYTGCVPSKSLLATARAMHDIRRAGEYGISVGEPTLNLGAAMDRKERIIARIEDADSPAALERAGVQVISGAARFVGSHAVAVGERVVHGERFVVATGSRPSVPPIPGLLEAGYLTNVEAMALRDVPARLAVIGAGPTGLELGQAFARFGSAVPIVDHADQILPQVDGEIATLTQSALEREGIRFLRDRTVERVALAGNVRRLALRTRSGDQEALAAEAVLVATGRAPNVEGLGLEDVGVQAGERGVVVDSRLRTAAAHVWACGDVIGPPFSTHAAEDQARTVATNVLGGTARWSSRVIPWVTFTDPEVAGVGLTEAAARARYGDRLEVLRLPYAVIDRAVTDGVSEGLIKVLLAPGWTRGRLGGEIAGAHVVGERAGDLIHQFAFLMAWRLPAGLLAKTVQAYPTYSLGGRMAVGLHWRQAARPSAAPSVLGKLLGRLAG